VSSFSDSVVGKVWSRAYHLLKERISTPPPKPERGDGLGPRAEQVQERVSGCWAVASAGQSLSSIPAALEAEGLLCENLSDVKDRADGLRPLRHHFLKRVCG